ncbi:MAG: penicillin-insensitive murein endopeptidase [Deltaproteobacteria bacterium]|nr:penicillin-insensitive murein endopeptidase [Deltaproteobacteria bacterium]
MTLKKFVQVALVCCAACNRSAPPPRAEVPAVAALPRATELPGPATALAAPVTRAQWDDDLQEPAPQGRFGQTPGAHSRSVGTAQNGALQGGLALRESNALRILPQTKRNALYFATAELTGLLERSAEALAQDHPGAVLRVANLSRQEGGDIGPSVSHNSGRDADVMFFAVDRFGSPKQPDNFCHFDATGVADGPTQDAGRYEFDAARNWTLVRHWLSDPDVVVQWIFVAIPLRNQMLDYALRQGEPEGLRRRAAQVLVQPRDSSPHADHFHLRIACPPGDRPGCIDGGGVTAQARDAQIDSLLEMYHHGSPAEQRYARELLSLPPDADLGALPPIEGED